MSKQPNQDRSNRAKARRAKREAARVPGAGAGQPIPIRQAPSGQPAANSLADLAKAGGQVPINIPQLMAKLGVVTTERDFWMNAAVNLEAQVNELTGGIPAPSVEDVAAAEEGEIQDIPVAGVEQTECPGCGVTLGPEAVHADGCQFQGHEFTEEEEEPAQIGANVPAETPQTGLTEEEQEVVEQAALITAQKVRARLQEETPE